MIREATIEDIPAIMEMGKRFADEAGVTAQVGWEEESVEALLRHLIADPDGILLVADKGMIGGLVITHVFNSATRIFQEMFWRSEGAEGIKLLRAAEKAAKERGASRVLMLSTQEMDPERTGRLYGRLGFDVGETIYTKAI